MEDEEIVSLYWERSETAIQETAGKYGRYCHAIAYNILHSHEDSEECVNDTYMRAWNSMPPNRPQALKTFLGRIARNLSLDRYEKLTAKKRGFGEIPLVLEELQECVPHPGVPENIVEDMALAELFDRFLAALPQERRRIFVRRYWYLSPVREIAEAYGLGESRVKVSLMRSRRELRQLLEKEGVVI